MSGRPQLRTVVADTSALVSLGVVGADAAIDTEERPDPLQYLLTSCSVAVPPEVLAELWDLSQYRDIHGTAATNVLAARARFTVEDPYANEDGSTARPTFGLDDGETDAIVLANGLAVDAFLTDEFGGTNFALVHAALQGPRIVPAPRLLCYYARDGHMSHEDARALVEAIGRHRSWDDSPYVSRLLDQLG